MFALICFLKQVFQYFMKRYESQMKLFIVITLFGLLLFF